MANNQYIVTYNYMNTIYCGIIFMKKEILIILSDEYKEMRKYEKAE